VNVEPDILDTVHRRVFLSVEFWLLIRNLPQKGAPFYNAWESRVVGGISKRGGKVGFWTFPRSVFSTAFGAAFFVAVMATPWAL
jgi:hypothetical protein